MSSNVSSLTDRLVPAVHAQKAPVDVDYLEGLVLDLRENYDTKALVELYGRFSTADGMVDRLMRKAIDKAQKEATERIAYLPAYVGEVLKTLATPRRAPPQRAGPRSPPMTDAERDALNEATTREAMRKLGIGEVIDMEEPGDA